MTVEVLSEDDRWTSAHENIASVIEGRVFAYFQLDVAQFETAVLLTNDEAIRELNREFREKDKATDVLSWPAQNYVREVGETPPLPVVSQGPFASELGDIALGYETCLKDAGNNDFDAHISHLILHGFLHLLGYDHEDDRDAVIMEAIEVEILAKMNIPNPYLMIKEKDE